MDEKKADVFVGSEEGTPDTLDMTPSQERAMKRKIDWAIVPYCSLLYLLSASIQAHRLCIPCITDRTFPFSGFLDRVWRVVRPLC